MIKYKNIAISSGHGLKVKGASGVVDEVTEARKVVNKVAEYLKQVGCSVNVFHDDTSNTVTDNLKWIVSHHNTVARDLDVSVHFNAYKPTTSKMGVEVLYYDNKDLASEVSEAISKAGSLTNRGAKERKDLYFLNSTKKPAILIEVCFCDSQADVDSYNKNFDSICKAIVKAITGQTVSGGQSTTPPASNQTGGNLKLFRVVCGSYADRGNAEKVVADLKAKGFDSFIDIYYK